ncbi:hypothetical protein TrRE_jg104, partial [Triparma retinervis]
MIEVLYPYDQKWYPATVIQRVPGMKLLVNYQGFNEEAVVNPVDSCRKVPLMKGWIELVDEESGSPYYLHGQTGESRWERPTAASESVRRGAVGKGTKVVNRVTKDVWVKPKEKPYMQRQHTEKTDPHWRERGFQVGNMSGEQRKEYEDRRKSFAGGVGGGGGTGFKQKEKILADQKKRRASFSSVATRSISSSSLPVSNYYYDQTQMNGKNRKGWGESMGGRRQTSLGQ